MATEPVDTKHQTHRLRVTTREWEEFQSPHRTFDIRHTARDFQVGDYVVYVECDLAGTDLGRELVRRITYVLAPRPDMGLPIGLDVGWCAFSLTVARYRCEWCGDEIVDAQRSTRKYHKKCRRDAWRAMRTTNPRLAV